MGGIVKDMVVGIALGTASVAGIAAVALIGDRLMLCALERLRTTATTETRARAAQPERTEGGHG